MAVEIIYLSDRIEKQAIRVLSAVEKDSLDLSLIVDPRQGVVMPKTGGARKIRLPIRHKKIGSRGGARVVHYFWDSDEKVYIFAVYSKSKKDDIDEDDKKAIKEFIESLS